jgi:hypothetical protein
MKRPLLVRNACFFSISSKSDSKRVIPYIHGRSNYGYFHQIRGLDDPPSIPLNNPFRTIISNDYPLLSIITSVVRSNR